MPNRKLTGEPKMATVETYQIPQGSFCVAYSDRRDEMEVGLTLPQEAFDSIASHLGDVTVDCSTGSAWISVKDYKGREITIFRGRG